MIPHVFHFVFGLRPQTKLFHLMHYLCLKSCLEVQSPEKIIFHYHNEPRGELWERIKPHLVLRKIEDEEEWLKNYRYKDCLNAEYSYAHQADFIRLKVLNAEGGIYADIDTLFLRPIPESWRQRKFILGREKSDLKETESVCNAWIASAKGAKFGKLWLKGMHDSFDGSWSRHATQLPWLLSQEHPELIDIEPETSFYTFDWTKKSINNLFCNVARVPEGAYSLHLWEHLWGDWKRRDFSNFHSGCLTPDYVAYANTTYAREARRFLPDDIPVSRAAYYKQALKWNMQVLKWRMGSRILTLKKKP